MKNNHTPEIRFPGYTGDWDQRKLGDIFNILDGDRGKNYPGESDFNENGATLFLDTGNVKKNGFDFSTKKYITKEKDESLRSGKLELHDFVLTSRGTLGNVAYYDEKTRNNNPSVRINSAMLILRPTMNNQVSDDYMAAVLRGNIIDTFMLTNHVGSAQPHITKRDFSKVSIGIPSILEEQTKIGSFFKRLDETIALQQQELTTLKQTKQGFLQKMFPKEGESVPEIRFSGYIEDWEQRKFKDDIVSIQTGTNLLGSESNGGTPLIKMGNIQRGYFSLDKLEYLDDSETVSELDIINNGDFLFNTRNTLELVGKGATWFCESGKYAFNSNIARFTFKNINTYFFNYLYNTKQVIKQVRARAVGTTSVAAVYPRDLNSMKYMVPSIEEQSEIGNFFRQLDYTITLHQRELDALKETKKAFLQKMFV
ncbi:restriction endonuclease subunit S [Bacillus cereus group sp. N17]|uniref:restriction endonuclease subunit S n=1 Tax=Bacillus cereus group sp. N17 TaxID=2794589 RepID=UPI0018F2D601|nr:restriction endonuclease subunit S [Bacillus cereus group sp. N17]MBJ8042986.1 restriction endonuclease subunit S [Bacillus cereus group sp. N17]